MNPNFSSTVRLSSPPQGAPLPTPSYPIAAPSMRPVFAYVAPPRRSETPAVFYVLGSFALMMVLAALLSVFGSIAALTLLDDSDDEQVAPVTETAPPAASIR